MEKIVSMKNQKVKQWKKLQTTKGRKEARAYLIEGTHLLKEGHQSECDHPRNRDDGNLFPAVGSEDC